MCVLLQFNKMRVSLVILAVFAAFCAVNCEVFYEENFKDGKYTKNRLFIIESLAEIEICWRVCHM